MYKIRKPAVHTVGDTDGGLTVLKSFEQPSIMADMQGKYALVPRSIPGWYRGLALLAASTLLPVACEPPVQQVAITAQDFRFDPDTIHVSSNRPIHLTVFNQGREPHTFESPLLSDPSVRIERLTLAGVAGRPARWQIPPGKSLELRLRAPQGLYVFSCGMRGHTGMRGMIVLE